MLENGKVISMVGKEKKRIRGETNICPGWFDSAAEAAAAFWWTFAHRDSITLSRTCIFLWSLPNMWRGQDHDFCCLLPCLFSAWPSSRSLARLVGKNRRHLWKMLVWNVSLLVCVRIWIQQRFPSWTWEEKHLRSRNKQTIDLVRFESYAYVL